jgi:hypothetical protein
MKRNILAENMRRFNTKNLTESHYIDPAEFLEFAMKEPYTNVTGDIMSAAEYFALALEEPKMEYLPHVQHGIQQLTQWVKAKKPAPLVVYILVNEAPALLDAMQAKSKKAWMEMRSHWGAIIDACADEDADEYVTSYNPKPNDMI